MGDLFTFEKPLGLRDTVPHIYEMKAHIESCIVEEMKRWGYRLIETPTIEYYDTIGAASALPDEKLLKLLDYEGRSLVLRPEMTAPIARMAATRLLKENQPLRLAYSSYVYRAQHKSEGTPAEFKQIGVECIADNTVSADGEMIALLIATLEKTALNTFQISIGNIQFVRVLFLQILEDEEQTQTLTTFLYTKNDVGYREYIKTLSLSSKNEQRLLDFLKLRGHEEVLEKASALLEEGEGKKVVRQMKKLWQVMMDYGVEKRIKLDFTLVSQMNYYSGVLFEVYSDQVGFPIGNGGRYDYLFNQFGKNTGATGFALRLDLLVEAIGYLNSNKPRLCILFSEDRRKEAYHMSKEKRAQGLHVVLQDIKGVTHLDTYKDQYEETILLIGDAERTNT
ncbi:ATP phosphoribosyltransferase regulatory subunit [Hazenella sp. IB182353]|uniref:ATP phosphoribosyltransferase regulatory subunit n=1 Tax=Polycladospora coralii TaxID=2771432 RepID=UPI0017468958|nr:ATP phosphoribosyltransferase regulatory subunit [Polycladospora coralii]MBS7531127.1 ATP phosphoribosyltransferase regulatory subunit [Polycladospora coralii]